MHVFSRESTSSSTKSRKILVNQYETDIFKIHEGDIRMRSKINLIGLSIMFIVFAAAFSVIFWEDVSLAAKIGLFAFGFASGSMAGQWFAKWRA